VSQKSNQLSCYHKITSIRLINHFSQFSSLAHTQQQICNKVKDHTTPQKRHYTTVNWPVHLFHGIIYVTSWCSEVSEMRMTVTGSLMITLLQIYCQYMPGKINIGQHFMQLW